MELLITTGGFELTLVLHSMQFIPETLTGSPGEYLQEELLLSVSGSHSISVAESWSGQILIMLVTLQFFALNLQLFITTTHANLGTNRYFRILKTF